MDKNFEDLLVASLYRKILHEIPEGRRIRIEALDKEDALRLAKRLDAIAQNELADEILDDLSIAVLSESETRNSGTTPLAHAIGLRNRISRLVFFIPNGEVSSGDSVGLPTFDSVNIVDVYAEIISNHYELISELDGGTEIVRILRQNLPGGLSSQELAEFLVTVFNSNDLAKNFGLELWRIGLIPDSGTNPESRLDLNRRTVNAIKGVGKPLSSISERLIGAGLVDGDFFHQLIPSLEPFPKSISEWAKSLGTNNHFQNWPFAAESELEISDLIITPFVDANDKLDPTCKLKRDPITGGLFAESKITIKWATLPSQLGTIGSWLVEIVPAEGTGTEFNTLRSMVLLAKKRSTTISLDLSEEELENLAPRYVVKITATDGDGRPLHFIEETRLSSGKQIASAESQEFQILSDDVPDLNNSKTRLFRSVPDALIVKALEGRDNLAESAARLDLGTQSFTINVGPVERVQIDINSFILQCELYAMQNSEKAYWMTGTSRTGTPIEFERMSKHELFIPSQLHSKRKKFLDIILQAKDGRNFVETVKWTKDLVRVTEQYAEAYREALKNESGDKLRDLLLLDTVSLSSSALQGEVNGALVLPIHPLRALWISKHTTILESWVNLLIKTSRGKRSQEVDLKLVERLSAANLPFAILAGNSMSTLSAASYGEEVTYGSAIYVPGESTDFKNTCAILTTLISHVKQRTVEINSADLVGERIARYIESKSESAGARVLALNAGDGRLLSESHRRASKKLDSTLKKLRFEYDAFGELSSFSDPLSALVNLQIELEEQFELTLNNYLAPRLGIRSMSANKLDDQLSKYNLAVIEGLTDHSTKPILSENFANPSMHGLITQAISSKALDEGRITFQSVPAVGIDVRKRQLITELHDTYLKSLARYLGGKGTMGITLDVNPEMIQKLLTIHDATDWVITVDKYIGLAVYEDVIGQALGGAYVLDYAPDFIDGFGERVTVTTTKEKHLITVISKAMDVFGLVNQGVTAGDLLRSLAAVSGRLALRLMGEDTKAMEALGLSATMTYLSLSGQLHNTVIVPVDAHMDLFGMHSRQGTESGERCDVILIRFKDKSHSIELVEVKGRANKVEAELPTIMETQVQETKKVLNARLFDKENPRIDSDLQWARWAGILRFYADRSRLHGFVNEDNFQGILEAIDRIESNHEKPVMKMTGYILALNGGNNHLPSRQGELDIVLLDQARLKNVGFTTSSIDLTSLTTNDDNTRMSAQEIGENKTQIQSTSTIESEDTNEETDIGNSTDSVGVHEAPKGESAIIMVKLGKLITDE